MSWVFFNNFFRKYLIHGPLFLGPVPVSPLIYIFLLLVEKKERIYVIFCIHLLWWVYLLRCFVYLKCLLKSDHLCCLLLDNSQSILRLGTIFERKVFKTFKLFKAIPCSVGISSFIITQGYSFSSLTFIWKEWLFFFIT